MFVDQLFSQNAAEGDRFGYSVALSEDGARAVIGAPHHDASGLADSGEVCVFERTGTAWAGTTCLSELVTADVADRFGFSVSITGDGRTFVAGSPQQRVDGVLVGGARVFEKQPAAWVQTANLFMPASWVQSYLGMSVAVSAGGTHIVLGAPYYDDGTGNTPGGAVVFVHAGIAWNLEAQLVPTDMPANGMFGMSVALSADGRVAVVGAPLDDTPVAVNAGSVRVFTRSGSTWTEEGRIYAADSAQNARFGSSVALSASGDTLLVGEPYGDSAASTRSGRALLFERNGAGWNPVHTFEPSTAATGDLFGYSVALSSAGDRAIIGAPQAEPGTYLDQGRAWLYEHEETGWRRLTAGYGPSEDGPQTGTAVAISGDGHHGLVASPFGDAQSLVDSGTVWVYRYSLALGAPCESVGQCLSGFCIDGVCCEEWCGEGAYDCQACSLGAGGSIDGRCTPLRADVAQAVYCRPAVDVCDVGETCSTDERTCPPDLLEPQSTVCRAAHDACDAPETCTGITADCPADAREPVGAVCSQGSCVDGVETPAGECDEQGACVVGANVTCAPYTCVTTVCADSCQSDASCAAGYRCDTGSGTCVSGEADGGTPDAGVPDAGDAGNETKGCGCGAATGGPAPLAWLVALGLVLALRRHL